MYEFETDVSESHPGAAELGMPALAAMGPGLQSDFEQVEARLATRGAATAEYPLLDEETAAACAWLCQLSA